VNLAGLSVGLAAAIVIGGAARAADFDDFQKFCVAPHGDAKAALAAADAAGWSALPAPLVEQLKQPGMVSVDGRMKTDAGAMRFLMLGGQAPVTGDKAGPRMDACIIGIAPPSAGLADQVKTWAAVPESAALSKNGMHGYAFIDEGGRHKAVGVDGADAAGAMKNPRTTFVMVQEQPQVTLLVYGVPSTTSPN
jgi:hypothetical protein